MQQIRRQKWSPGSSFFFFAEAKTKEQISWEPKGKKFVLIEGLLTIGPAISWGFTWPWAGPLHCHENRIHMVDEHVPFIFLVWGMSF